MPGKVPAHLSALTGVLSLDACTVCGDATDLTIEEGGQIKRRCWKDQGMAEVVVHQRCTGALCAQGNERSGGCWFAGPVRTDPRCPICARAG